MDPEELARKIAELNRCANGVGGQAQAVRAIANQIGSLVQSTEWTGNRAQEFYNRAHQAQLDLEAWASRLERLEADVRQAAREL